MQEQCGTFNFPHSWKKANKLVCLDAMMFRAWQRAGRPFNLLWWMLFNCDLRHTRALLTANALLTSSAANQMSRKTTSRNVNNAICGQPRGSIGACACRPLQLCLPLPLSVRPFLSLSLSVSRSLNRRLFVYFCCRWRSTSYSFYFVSPRCPITFAERNICCCRKSSSLVREKKNDTMKRHLSDSEPEINEDYDECSR